MFCVRQRRDDGGHQLICCLFFLLLLPIQLCVSVGLTSLFSKEKHALSLSLTVCLFLFTLSHRHTPHLFGSV